MSRTAGSDAVAWNGGLGPGGRGMSSPAGRRVGRGAEATKAGASHARRLLLGTALILCGSRPLSAADAPGCARLLRALDAGGLPVWQSIAVVLPRAGHAAAPLHVLERGGRRYDRLEISDGADGWIPLAPRVTPRPEANLAWLDAPGLAACGERGQVGDAGSALLVVRERVGYRSASIGARVERRLGLGSGGEVVLLRLLDERGADPGLVFDPAGRFLGATRPAPPAAQGSLAALAPAPDDVSETSESGAGAGEGFPTPRPSPSAADTAPGCVARALLDGGPGAGERGIDLLGTAMTVSGPSAALLIERGVREFGAGRLPSAIADFREAAGLAPGSHLARYNLGMALGMAGRYDEAATALEAARDRDPAHGLTRYQLVLALSAAHRTNEARQEYQALLAMDPALARDLVSLPGL